MLVVGKGACKLKDMNSSTIDTNLLELGSGSLISIGSTIRQENIWTIDSIRQQNWVH